MFTVKEIAAQLNVSLGIVYKEIALRRLRCYRIGAAIRISPEQLADYLDGSNTTPAPKHYKHVRRIGG